MESVRFERRGTPGASRVSQRMTHTHANYNSVVLHHILIGGVATAAVISCQLLALLTATCNNNRYKSMCSAVQRAGIESMKCGTSGAIWFLHHRAWTNSVRKKDWRSRKRGTQAMRAPCTAYSARHASYNSRRAASQAFERMEKTLGNGGVTMRTAQHEHGTAIESTLYIWQRTRNWP